MGANPIYASKIAKSVSVLIKTLDESILPTVEDLIKEGWITARDYAVVAKIHESTARSRLSCSDNIERKRAKLKNVIVYMYKAKDNKNGRVKKVSNT